jgi:amino acid permease
VFNNYGWAYWIYFFVSEAVAFIAAGLIIARWFVPREAAATPAQAPAETPRAS